MRTGKSNREQKRMKKAARAAGESHFAQALAKLEGNEQEAQRQGEAIEKAKNAFEMAKAKSNRKLWRKDAKKRPVEIEIRRSRRIKRHPNEK